MGITHSKRSVDITTTAKAPKEAVAEVTRKGDLVTNGATAAAETHCTNGSVEERDIYKEATEEMGNDRIETEGDVKESKLTSLKKRLNFSFMRRRVSTKEEKIGSPEASSAPEENEETKEVEEFKNPEEVKEPAKEVKETEDEGITASEEGALEKTSEPSEAAAGVSGKTVSRAEEVAVSKAEVAAVTEEDVATIKEGVIKEAVAIVEEAAIKEEISEKEESIVSEKEATNEMEEAPATGELETKEVEGSAETKEVEGSAETKDLNVTYEVRRGEVSGE